MALYRDPHRAVKTYRDMYISRDIYGHVAPFLKREERVLWGHGIQLCTSSFRLVPNGVDRFGHCFLEFVFLVI